MTNENETPLDQRILRLATDLERSELEALPDMKAKDIIEHTAMGLWQIIICAIEQYADHTDYTTWSLLSDTIAETFEQNKINPLDRSHLYLMIHGNDPDTSVSEYIVMTERAAQSLEVGTDSVLQKIDPLNDNGAGVGIQHVMRDVDMINGQVGRVPRRKPDFMQSGMRIGL